MRGTVLPALVGAVVALAGCGTASTGPATDTAAAPLPTVTASSGQLEIDTSDWVTAFRDEHPDLAEGRSDDEIAAVGDRICGWVGEPAITREVLTRRVTDALDAGGTPVAQDATGVAQLAVPVLCPQLTQELNTLP